MTQQIFDPTTDYITPEGEIVKNGLLHGGADSSGTELTVIQTKDAIGSLVDATRVPIHIAKMREYGVTAETMASYVNVPWVDVMAYVNRVVEVIGCAIWFSGEFVPQARPDTVESGYHKVLFKLRETKTVKGVPIGDRVVSIEQNVIVQTSGKKVAEMALVFLNEHGWFDWKDSIHVLFGGNKDAGYLVQPVDTLISQLKQEQH